MKILSMKGGRQQMKAIIKSGRKPGVECVDIPRPIPKADEVLIQVKATAICGTDIHYWKWNDSAEAFANQYNVKFPFVLGHECAGIVTEVGPEVTGIEAGDHVAFETHIYCGHCYQCRTGNAHNCRNLAIYGTSCDGCFAEFATAPASVCFKLPETVGFEEGARYEPGGVAMHAVQRSDVQPSDTVLVFGCGAIGQMVTQIMMASGAGRVIAVDIDDYKVGMARAYGAIGVNSAKEDLGEVVKRYTADRGGVDVIVEVTGAPSVYETLFDYLRPEGHVVTVAHPGRPIPINITKSINTKGATLRGVFGRRIWDTWYALSGLVENQKIDLNKVITHRFPLSQCTEAFEQTGKGAGKILFIPEWD